CCLSSARGGGERCDATLLSAPFAVARGGSRRWRTTRDSETNMLDGLRADLRVAFRSIRTSQVYALSSIVTLGIGVAAPTTIFCVVQTVMLQALPYRAPEQLVMLFESSPSRHLPKVGTTPPHLKDWQEQSRAFVGFAAVE